VQKVGDRRGLGLGTAAAAALGLVVAAITSGASPAGAAPVPEVQLVVQLAASAAVHPGGVLDGLPGSLPRFATGNRWSLSVPAGEVGITLARLRADHRVLYASQVGRVHATDVPNDPCFTTSCGGPSSSGAKVISGNPGEPGAPETFSGEQLVSASQHDLIQIGAPAAWSMTHGSTGVKVAVLDSGVDTNQQDLAGGRVAVGPNECIGDDSACGGVTSTNSDNNGHGTHVTGTVGASTANGTGVSSLGWNTSVETFKVLDSMGDGSTLDLATGIRDAVAAGASVINMSLGNPPCSVDPTSCGPDPDTMAAVEFAQQHNVVVVAAAGNGTGGFFGGSTEPTYPASYPGVLSVASVDGSGSTSTFSEYGSAANIAAPGENVLSTWNDPDNRTYAVLTGTSMATPHVAAAAALVRAYAPSLSAAQVVSVLETTAGPVQGHSIAGGLLNVPAALSAAVSGSAYNGYRLAGSDGSVYPFGADPYFGDVAGAPLARPIVATAGTPDHAGYWTAASDGGVFTFGSAGFYGSTGAFRLNRPIVGMAPTRDGHGYWLVASDGGIFAFGDAVFHGSTGGFHLNQPIVGMAATPDGGGYWLVASDGGIFAFGDARFFGSTGAMRLNKPVVGMAATPDGGGYWLVGSDGGIFAFGDAHFYGSTGSFQLNQPVVAILGSSQGAGYLLAASDGGLFAFGDARFEGSTGGQPIPGPVVGLAA
jgi:subtilisin family serine protease